MDKTVDLVTQWAAFSSRNPQADLEDFYRYQLIEAQQSRQQGAIADGIVPPEINLLLIKLINRIDRLYLAYAEKVIEGTGLRHFEEFLFMNAIAHLQQPRKTDVINHTITGLSSGLLIIDRLKKYGFVSERDDETDKRSRRLVLTDAGAAVLQDCYGRTSQLGRLFFGSLSEDDMRLCVHLLTGTELKFAQLWPRHKSKSYAAIQDDYR
ncbi:MarR family winged helix-turn-helix transcriptional regulator [Spirosoma arcticum]